MDRTVLLEIISEIEKELNNLSELQTELGPIINERGITFKRSKGSILHDFYNCCERVFKCIAAELNGGHERTEGWHKALLYKMTIPIAGIRPAVITEELAAELDEFLAFRHLFRNIYGFELKGDRIDRLAERFNSVSDRFEREIKEFTEALKKA